MSGPRRRKPAAPPSRRRRPAAARDFWGRENNEDHTAVIIRPSDDPTAMIRSLGPPPLPGGETVAEHQFVVTYQKAATLAIALAAASGLLDTDEHDD
jgi:hypothetical protein